MTGRVRITGIGCGHPNQLKVEKVEALHAFERVWSTLVAGLKGESWNKSAAVIKEFRAASIPGLLRSTSA